MTQELKNNKEIMLRLARIQKDMDYLKEYIEDITLDEDDFRSIEKADKEYKEGKTKKRF